MLAVMMGLAMHSTGTHTAWNNSTHMTRRRLDATNSLDIRDLLGHLKFAVTNTLRCYSYPSQMTNARSTDRGARLEPARLESLTPAVSP